MCMADKFPESLPGFQKMFPDDAACVPTHIAKPGVLRCKAWRGGL